MKGKLGVQTSTEEDRRYVSVWAAGERVLVGDGILSSGEELAE